MSDKMVELFKEQNKKAKPSSIVFFGTKTLEDIPVAEIIRDVGIDTPVFNRSIANMRIDDACRIVDTCVCKLNPEKVFINIGEHDVEDPSLDYDRFFEKYEWLLYSVHSKCNCRIYIMSIPNDNLNKVNKKLKEIANKYNCEFVDTNLMSISVLDFFKNIRVMLRCHPITFCDAINLC